MPTDDILDVAREALAAHERICGCLGRIAGKEPCSAARLAQAVLDKDAELSQIAHAQVAYAPPWCVELLKEIQASRDMWQSAHMELRAEREQQDARIKELEAALNTPGTEDFDKAVPLEAAHQVQRWGTTHDAGKNPEDWFWLLGYLSGKALASCRSGDTTKAKHHCISSAAVLRNWHAHIRSGQSEMRPGISEEARAALAGKPEGGA